MWLSRSISSIGARARKGNHRRLSTRMLTVFAVGLTVPGVVVAAETRSPVRRVSVNRDVDLLDALLREDRFEDAIALCEAQIAGADGNSLDRARWTVGHSRAKTAESLSRGTLSDEVISKMTEPVSELVEAYADSPYRSFLRFQEIDVLRASCFQDCVSASINGPDSEDAQRGVARGARLIRESEALIKDVQQQRVNAEANANGVSAGIASDLSELSQRIHVDVVRTMLVITDVFPDDSEDQHDAATKALRYANTSLQSLPPGSDGWIELQLLRIEAIHRTGNVRSAMEAFQSLPTVLSPTLALRQLALRLRLGLANEEWGSVSRQLESFYGSDATVAPRSFEMDLVRLRFLLRLQRLPAEQLETMLYAPADIDAEIPRWIETIAERHGDYERRRAEAIVLRELKASSTDDALPSRAVNPSLVATQGEDWLRRGDPKRAGDLLAAAALADTDGSRAIVHASKSAAAYIADSDPFKAASVLYRVAIKHSTELKSPAIAVQAAMLLGQAKDNRYSSQIETMVRETVTTWPIEGPVAAARQWLIDGLEKQARWIDAAEVATLNFESRLDDDKLHEIVALWQFAAMQVPSDQLPILSDRFESTFAAVDLTVSPSARDGYLSAAAFALTRDKVRSLDTSTPSFFETSTNRYTLPLALLQFRKKLIISDALRSPAAEWQTQLERRLMNDAIADPSCRKVVAGLIESWQLTQVTSLSHIRRLTWLGKIDDARLAAKALVAESMQQGETVRELAQAFESSDKPASRLEAVFWWDELASGLPHGSDPWYEAKLRAAELLAQLGRKDEAAKRAKYILLTQPPGDAGVKKRYEAIASPAE